MHHGNESNAEVRTPPSGAPALVDPEELLKLVDLLTSTVAQLASADGSWEDLQGGMKKSRFLKDVDERLISQMPLLLGVPESLRQSLIHRVARGPRK